MFPALGKKDNPESGSGEPPKKLYGMASGHFTPSKDGGMKAEVPDKIATKEEKAGVNERLDNGGIAHIYAIAVGAGNGGVIVTPNNEIIIVDLGSTRPEAKYGDVDATEDGKEYVIKDTAWSRGQKTQVSAATIFQLLNTPSFLANDKRIKALIISHADYDHYSYIGILDLLGVEIENVYFSNLLGAYTGGPKPVDINDRIIPDGGRDTTGRTMQGGRPTYQILNGLVKRAAKVPSITDNWKLQPLRSLTFTGTENGRTCPADAGAFDDKTFYLPPASQTITIPTKNLGELPPKSNKVVTQVRSTSKQLPQSSEADRCPYFDETGVFLFKEEDTRGNPFLVKALVSNFLDCRNFKSKDQTKYEANIENRTTSYITDGIQKNQASLVVSIEYLGETCLILGDINDRGKQFLLENYPDLKDVDYLNMSHHGADENYALKEFADKMNPKTLVVSARRVGSSPEHPTEVAIMNYLNRNAVTGALYDETAKVQFGFFSAKQVNKKIEGEEIPGYLEAGSDNSKNRWYEFVDQPVRLFHTGWMLAGWHNYRVGLGARSNVAQNLFKSRLSFWYSPVGSPTETEYGALPWNVLTLPATQPSSASAKIEQKP